MKLYNEAINVILQALGEPLLVDEDSIEGIFEAEQAEFTIDQVKKQILSEGWYVNTDENWPLLPDTNGYIAVPSTALKIDSSASTGKNLIVKDYKLYDKDNQTYIFDTTVGIECDIVWNVDFDDLPHSFQRYITLKAARTLSQRLDGDINMIRVLIQDEQEALALLKREEFDSADYSIFDNDNVRRVVDRTSNPRGV